MNINIHTLSTAVDILVCAPVEDIRNVNEYRCRTANATDIHNKRLATEYRCCGAYTMRILANKAKNGNN